MSGETDLQKLLEGMAPRLDPRRFVFVAGEAADRARFAALAPLMLFEEPEGPSAILEAETAAQAGLPAEPRFAMITLEVFSSLEAIGLTAAVAKVLARNDIPANVVAATRHDHVFVPEAQAEKAMQALQDLALAARGAG